MGALSTAKVQSYPTRGFTSHPIAMQRKTTTVRDPKINSPKSQALVKGHFAVITMSAYKLPRFDLCFLAAFGLGFVAGGIPLAEQLQFNSLAPAVEMAQAVIP